MKRTRLFPIVLAGTLLLIVSAQGAVYQGAFSGLNEVPPTASKGTGFATLTLLGNLLFIDLTFTGLTNIPILAPIYCCTPPGTNTTFAVISAIPMATSGVLSTAIDLTLGAFVYGGAFFAANGGAIASAEAALIAGLNAGLAYVDITDSSRGESPGEIRANLVPQASAVPEPSTSLLLMTGLLGVAGLARRRSEV